MGEEETNLLRRRIPNNFCRYSTVKEVEHNSLLCKCGPCTMTSFQSVQYGKEEKK